MTRLGLQNAAAQQIHTTLERIALQLASVAGRHISNLRKRIG